MEVDFTFGQPEGVNLSRGQHEILLNEIVILMTESGHYIDTSYSEADLRCEFLKTNRTGDKSGIADFPIDYYEKTSQTCCYIEGEIAVSYTLDQIKNKPSGMLWFCYDRHEAEKKFGFVVTKKR